MPGERITEEESEDSEGTDTASIGDISETSDTDSIEVLMNHLILVYYHLV